MHCTGLSILLQKKTKTNEMTRLFIFETIVLKSKKKKCFLFDEKKNQSKEKEEREYRSSI